jgi:hypothetical protein|tara:strand:+ start:29 stop:448 length:420 start_codon:yes stop_codon:yes gene_type:complete
MGFPQKEWLVYFYEASGHNKSIRFFKKGYKHCGAIGYCVEKDIWIMQEFIYGKYNVEILEGKDVDTIFRFIKKVKGKVLKGTMKEDVKLGLPRLFSSWIKEHSCVSYVQRLLGMTYFWIFTPYQLFCALKKQKFYEIEL